MSSKILQVALAAACALGPAWAQTSLQPSVTISPASAPVHLGTVVQFSARVTFGSSTVKWSVALPAGATGSPGSIDVNGLYTAPSSFGTIGSSVEYTVIVTATTTTATPVSGTAQVSLQTPYPTVASTIPSSLPVGDFTITVNGSGFVPGVHVMFGGVQLNTAFGSSTRLTALGTAAASQNGQLVPVTVVSPPPGSVTSNDVVSVQIGSVSCGTSVPVNPSRFLDQAAFGPDAATVAHVQCVGLGPYIAEQLAAPISPYPEPSQTNIGIGQVQARFFSNAVQGRDQLRQRVAFALGQIFVVSAFQESSPAQLVPYLKILQQDAFGNFRQLMEDVTLSPTMGEYLNMVNNDKANAALGTQANENYARELMQLFTIGLYQLNLDGTYKLDGSNQPIPTYNQSTISNFAKIYTGWTYPTEPGTIKQIHNPRYYVGPMVPYALNHDTTSKTLLSGVVIPAGQSPNQDLKDALDNIFSYPSMGPFISKQLIQHLVTSNPSPAYVGRVAAVFNDNGHGTRGDLGAVVTAILMDSEARADDPGPPVTPPDTGGHLREPVVYVASVLRGLGAAVNDTNNLAGLAAGLGQVLFSPGSVFNYFAPSYAIPGQFTPNLSLLGPEFQIDSPSAAVARYNLANSIVYGNLGAGAIMDFSPFTNLGNNVPALGDLAGSRFFNGHMPGPIYTELDNAMNAITGTTAAAELARAQAAIYLAVTSSYFSVEH